MEIISMDVKAFDALAGHVEAIERKAEALCRRQEDVSLKKWLDNQDVCDVLGISKRTLQTYREKGLLPFSRIPVSYTHLEPLKTCIYTHGGWGSISEISPRGIPWGKTMPTCCGNCSPCKGGNGNTAGNGRENTTRKKSDDN